ncbi:MAG: hypothetical protein HRU19_00045 [Pseudobacteriovorax sp.]|nr:hypothetical protein [Pseudobacteriovorax sp.]
MDKALAFFKKFPILGLVVCLGVLIGVTGPKFINEAQMSGWLPGGEVFEGEIQRKYTDTYRRKMRERTACKAEVMHEQSIYNVRMDCDEWNSTEVGDLIGLFRDTNGKISSTTFSAGNVWFDLGLGLVLIFGSLYYGFATLARFKSA